MKKDWSRPVRDDRPEPGLYRLKLVRGGPWCGVRIWYGAPPDPDQPGALLDRSHRWQASINGNPCPIDQVWPWAAGRRIDQAEYRYLIALSQHAKAHAPELPEADPTKPIDHLRVRPPF